MDVAYMWGIVISSFLYGELGSCIWRGLLGRARSRSLLSILSGVYLVMFCIALYILLLPLQPSYRARREPVNRVLVSVAVLMCITCTLVRFSLPLTRSYLNAPRSILSRNAFAWVTPMSSTLNIRARNRPSLRTSLTHWRS